MDKILEIKNLYTSFFTQDGEVKAVRNVSFDIYRGETLGIVGESGSGKSVTAMSILKILANSARIINGEIIFDGIDLVKASNKKMRDIRGGKISMIFQDPMSSLNPLLTVGDQVGEMLLQHKGDMSKKAIKEEVLSLFKLVRIPEPEKRYSSYPHEFSGGMRQRVMIAMALACRPVLMIADEPTTALDVTIQDQIIKLIKNVQKEYNMAVMFITHDLGVIAELCSRVLVMYGGMVMEEGYTGEIFKNPSHPYTLGLMNSIPKITQNRERELEPIAGSPPDMLNPPKGCPFVPRCAYARNICGEKIPPYFMINESHRSMCWLLQKEAPKTNNPFSKKLD